MVAILTRYNSQTRPPCAQRVRALLLPSNSTPVSFLSYHALTAILVDMASTAFDQSSGWRWPDNVPTSVTQPQSSGGGTGMPGSFGDNDSLKPEESPRRSTSHRPPRTCRICLETVQPTVQLPSSNLPDFLQSTISVIYVSADPEAGRLIRPCKCKGSVRYVHEGCLQAWRHADPAYGTRNYWQCPTCGFRYRLERMRWARWVSSQVTQITLTISILLLAIFLLGFVADPIINLYLDPYTTLSSVPLSRLGTNTGPLLSADDDASWTEHLLKGLASLGLLSFIKVLLALSPWQWWNLRSSGLMTGSGRAGASGRDRLASLSWFVVLIGVCTFLWVSMQLPAGAEQVLIKYRASTKACAHGAGEP